MRALLCVRALPAPHHSLDRWWKMERGRHAYRHNTTQHTTHHADQFVLRGCFQRTWEGRERERGNGRAVREMRGRTCHTIHGLPIRGRGSHADTPATVHHSTPSVLGAHSSRNGRKTQAAHKHTVVSCFFFFLQSIKWRMVDGMVYEGIRHSDGDSGADSWMGHKRCVGKGERGR